VPSGAGFAHKAKAGSTLFGPHGLVSARQNLPNRPAKISASRQKLPRDGAVQWFPPQRRFSPPSSALLVNATRAPNGTAIA
jgi:hypothetical protein